MAGRFYLAVSGGWRKLAVRKFIEKHTKIGNYEY